MSIPNPLSRAASIRRMSVSDANEAGYGQSNLSSQEANRGLTDAFDDANPEYDELDGIAPLPLYLLMAADRETASASGESAVNNKVLEKFSFF